MTAAEIIAKFELYVDDSTELSSDEELDLCNDIYYMMCEDRQWRFLESAASGTMASATTITLPSDFGSIIESYDYDQSAFNDSGVQGPTFLYLGTKTFSIISWKRRRDYEDLDGYCYIDVANDQIVFTKAQTVGAYGFDYIKVPEALTLETSPLFPERFHKGISFGMAVDDMIIQLFDKARSYAQDNQIKYDNNLGSMSLWDIKLQTD